MTDMLELMRKNKWSLHCSLCGKNVFEHPLDYYMLKDELWEEITDNDYINREVVLCRGCAEQILGRKFRDEDFTDAPINYDYIDENTKVLKNRKYKLED